MANYFQIVPTVSEKLTCAHGKPCVRVRLTESRIEYSEETSCERKTLPAPSPSPSSPHCAPINCHFVEEGQECMRTTKTENVTLFEEECEVCEPDYEEEIVPNLVCKDHADRRCANGVRGRWVRWCEGNRRQQARQPREEMIVSQV